MKKTISIFWQIMLADFWAHRHRVIKKSLLSLLPFFIYMFTLVFVLPKMGFPVTYGILVIASGYVGADAEGLSASIFDGLNGGVITYLAALPVSISVVFLALMASFALRMLVMTIFLLPLLIPFIPSILSVAPDPSILLFLGSIVFSRVVDSAIGVWLAGVMSRPGDVTMICNRYIWPISFIAHCAPAWKAVASYSPRVGMLMLANPYQYIHELVRASIFGSEKFINPWLCILVMLVISIFFTWHGIFRLCRKYNLILSSVRSTRPDTPGRGHSRG